MIRLLLILSVAGALALGAAWLADHDGVLTLVIEGFEIRTSAFVAALLFLALVACVLAVLRLGLLIAFGPTKFRSFLASRRVENGEKILDTGLIAVASGDWSGAEQAVRRSRELLGPRPLVLLLEGQVALAAGDAAREAECYRAMHNHPETDYLGLRGEFALAQRRGENETALALAIRAQALKPQAPGTIEDLFDVRLARREWSEAEAILARAEQDKSLKPDSLQARKDMLVKARA